MSWWNDHVVPRLVEVSLRDPRITALRTETCTGLTGEVLELGFGSGLNLASLPATVTAVDAAEPSDLAWRLSEPRRARSAVPVTRRGLDGERLDVPDGSYDAVLVTFTLCTVDDPAPVLAEVRRALRPGGMFCFLEHGLAPAARVRAWQRRLEPVQRRVAGGCHLTRDAPALVTAAGFEIQHVREQYLPGPVVSRPWTYGFLGQARAPG